MTKPNITHLANTKNDNRLISPADTLRELLDDIEAGNVAPDSILVITLRRGKRVDDRALYGDGAKVGFRMSNMFFSEAITLMEMLKRDFLEDMKFVD